MKGVWIKNSRFLKLSPPAALPEHRISPAQLPKEEREESWDKSYWPSLEIYKKMHWRIISYFYMCLEITVYIFLLLFFILFCYIPIQVCLCVAQRITNFYFKKKNTLLCTLNCASWSLCPLNLTYLFSVHSAIWFNCDVH